MAFFNLQRLMDANKDDLEAEGQDALSPVEGDLNRANNAISNAGNGLDPRGQNTTDVAIGAGKEALLMDPEGRAGILQQKHAQQGGYGSGMAAFDSALAGGSQAVQGAQSRYGNLMQRLTDAQKSQADLVQHRQDEAAKSAMATQADRMQHPTAQAPAAAPGMSPQDKMGDEQLTQMGYGYSQAPGESYAHYSDRIARRGTK
jgi:hypothetical protein